MNSILIGVLADVFQAMLGAIPWKKIYDQYLYRLIAKSLRSLAKRSSNKVDDELVEAIIDVLDTAEVPEVDRS